MNFTPKDDFFNSDVDPDPSLDPNSIGSSDPNLNKNMDSDSDMKREVKKGKKPI